jgi:hypothetical protein
MRHETPYHSDRRAFELAKSGKYLYVSEIRERLRSEGYSTDTVSGPLLVGQLKTAIVSALKEQRKPFPQGKREGSTQTVPMRPLSHRARDRDTRPRINLGPVDWSRVRPQLSGFGWAALQRRRNGVMTMKSVVLWLLGVPIVVIVLLNLTGMLGH